MKIIKICNCSECPYSEFNFEEDPNQKLLWTKENMKFMGRIKTITTYTCKHYDLEKNEKYVGYGKIPSWCPLENE